LEESDVVPKDSLRQQIKSPNQSTERKLTNGVTLPYVHEVTSNGTYLTTGIAVMCTKDRHYRC